MRRLEFVLIFVSILGLALYLWGALAAPVVLWLDSQIDMDWARNAATPARRANSLDLSTGVRAGSLDWWAQPGADWFPQARRLRSR